MTGFVLPDAPLLSRSTVDRTEPMRADVARQRELWPTARVLSVDPAGRIPVREGRLQLRLGPELGDAPPPGAALLGEAGGVAYWAVPVPRDGTADEALWRDLRSCGAELDDTGAGLLTTAVAVLGWHARSRFCARCGSPIELRAAGWASVCTANGHEEYPRTDPSMICLVHDRDDSHVLLARQPIWPQGRFSVLAGFVEAGESVEACVIREVTEEVGVAVREVRYLGSQPWPFPRSLMLGFAAVADIDAPLTPADGEIEQIRWVSRADLRDALDAGAWADRDGSGYFGTAATSEPAPLVLPPSVSIARRMLEAWAAYRP